MRILITGGAGFVGCHAAKAFASDNEVAIIDNLSRKGSESNLAWLQANADVAFHRVDIREAAAVAEVVNQFKPDAVIHLAGQVAVTTSVTDPRMDFEINALGTFNVLEAVRQWNPKTIFLFASTNKVYGGMEDAKVELSGQRYQYSELREGVSESWPLDFHSPYGCSKGAADQYVRDYSRIYGLRSIVFRMSCIYGTRQFGVEDQGWISWFTIRAALGAAVTVFGDGKQIRDVLWVDDLIRAYRLGIEKIDQVKGEVFNVGGGPENQLSLLELINNIQELTDRRLDHSFADWRPGDQRVYVSNTAKAERLLGWKPQVAPAEGIKRIYEWVDQNIALFR